MGGASWPEGPLALEALASKTEIIATCPAYLWLTITCSVLNSPVYLIYFSFFCQNIIDVDKVVLGGNGKQEVEFSEEITVFPWTYSLFRLKLISCHFFHQYMFPSPSSLLVSRLFFVYWICPTGVSELRDVPSFIRRAGQHIGSIMASWGRAGGIQPPELYWVFCVLEFSQCNTSLINELDVLHYAFMSLCRRGIRHSFITFWSSFPSFYHTVSFDEKVIKLLLLSLLYKTLNCKFFTEQL